MKKYVFIGLIVVVIGSLLIDLSDLKFTSTVLIILGAICAIISLVVGYVEEKL